MLLNAFSLNMVSSFPVSFEAREVTIDEARAMAPGLTSAVGHASTAAVFSDVLGTEVQANRATVALKSGDRVLVGQYRGPRLEEGVTTLPEGATIQWIVVTVR